MDELLKELGEEDLFKAESELLLIAVVGLGICLRWSNACLYVCYKIPKHQKKLKSN